MAEEIKILPEEYQRVEYIETTGTQWIDTMWKNTSKSKYIINYYTDNYGGNKLEAHLFGAENDYLARVNVRYYYNLMRGYFGTGSFAGVQNDEKYNTVVVDLKNNVGNINNSYIFYPSSNDDNLYTVYLFALHFNEQAVYPSEIRCFYFEIYDDDILVRKFVPCYRKSDGVIGMYDLCGSICPLTNTPFYTNSGSGTFTKGDNVYPQIKTRYDKLPNAYQEVEYIESSSTGFVNLEIPNIIGKRVYMDCMFLGTKSSRQLFGVTGSGFYWMGIDTNGYYQAGSSTASSYSGLVKRKIGHFINVSLDGDLVVRRIVDNVVINNTTASSDPSSSTYKVFGISSSYACYMRV